MAKINAANSYEEFKDDGTVVSYSEAFPKMNWILEHIVILGIFMGLSVMLVLYARSRL